MSQKIDSSCNSSGYSTSESESDEETYDVSNLCKNFKKWKPDDFEHLGSSSDASDSELESDCQLFYNLIVFVFFLPFSDVFRLFVGCE